MMSFTKPLTVVLAALILLCNSAYGAPIITKGRIALSHDGNSDPDDIGALPASLKMIDKAGLSDRVAHVHYNSQVWLDNFKNPKMRTSALEGADRFEIPRDRFFDAEAVYDAANSRDNNGLNDHLAAAINASSADDPLWLLVSGPYEVVWRAMRKSDSTKWQFVTIITHSAINDKQTGDGSGHTRSDVEALGFNRFIDIKDQNGSVKNNTGFGGNKDDFSRWTWMQNHADEDVKWVYERIVDSGKGDISDAGMTWYLLTGDDSGNPNKLQTSWAVPEPRAGLLLIGLAALLVPRLRRNYR